MRIQVRKSLKSGIKYVKIYKCIYLAHVAGVEGSGDSWSDDEDCEKSGCQKSKDKLCTEHQVKRFGKL